MPVAYRRTEAPAPRELVDRLEEQAGHRLPDDYRDYLLRQDGGRLVSNNQAVKYVFGVGDVPDYESMWANLQVYEGRVPPWLLPVASDEYGNLFAVSLRESDLGSVWFWDHEQEADEGEPPTEDNIELRAPSWTEFLESLQPVE
jgi:cell wall assembly regulator SMI1